MTPNTNTPMPFGKHTGVPLRAVPVDYLTWLAANKFTRAARPELHRAIRYLVFKHLAAEFAEIHAPETADDLV